MKKPGLAPVLKVETVCMKVHLAMFQVRSSYSCERACPRKHRAPSTIMAENCNLLFRSSDECNVKPGLQHRSVAPQAPRSRILLQNAFSSSSMAGKEASLTSLRSLSGLSLSLDLPDHTPQSVAWGLA